MFIAELEEPVRWAARSPADCRPALSVERNERRLRSITALVVDGGCDIRLRGGHQPDAVRVALLEWLPLQRIDLAVYENGRFRDSPEWALASLVRPPTIWAIDEVLAAASLHHSGLLSRYEQRAALIDHAYGLLELVHLARVRRVATRLAEQLPAEGLPRASATLAAGCAVVASDEEACSLIAAVQFARYAMSARVRCRLAGGGSTRATLERLA